MKPENILLNNCTSNLPAAFSKSIKHMLKKTKKYSILKKLAHSHLRKFQVSFCVSALFKLKSRFFWCPNN
jgi:hypothetical protein